MPAGGGLLQLVAQGKQDVFLTGNPQVSFFKMVYRRHTNFATESQAMYFDGTPNFGQRITCLVPRRGDLLGPIYLDVTLPRLTRNDASNTAVSYVNGIGNALIQEITFEVGEQEIDRQTGTWMDIWTQLTTPAGQRDAYNSLIGRVDTYTPPNLIPGTNSPGLRLMVPLQFFFCRNPGLYLPLLALQYHPIRINITLAPLSKLYYNPAPPPPIPDVTCPPDAATYLNPASITNIMLWGDYVYLDSEERRRFVSTSHEYLIEQVQYTPPMSVLARQQTVNVKVDFNHPIKEFIFVAQRDYMQQINEPFNYSNLAIGEDTAGSTLSTYLNDDQPRTDLISTAVLQLDGYDRFQVRDAEYFSTYQPYRYHTTTPINNFIYVYSLALRPEDAQPSGTLNASRIDSINWQITMNPLLDMPSVTPNRGNCFIRVYATNYNIFRVVNGYGGLLFTI
jgi:hypothetical protein